MTMKTTMRDQDSKELEQLFVRELSRDFKVNRNKVLPSLTTRVYTSDAVDDQTFVKNSKDDTRRKEPRSFKNIGEIVKNLCLSTRQDKSILYFLIYVAGVECDDELTIMIKNATDNYEGYEHPELINHDPFDIITEDLSILDKSFKHALEIKSLVLIEYILNGADKLYLNAVINDDDVLKLIENLDDNDC
jgi:hypothetical protein